MPTLRLILLRHAKSAWGTPSLADHDRPLNDRGRRSCAAIALWLAENAYAPDQVLCSTAVRTQETWELIAPKLPQAALDLDRALYLAELETMRACLDGATGRCVMMIGHNPGIAAFAGQMVMAAPAHPRFSNYPTAATTVMDFDAAAWSDVAPSSGTLVDFIVPRDLPGV